MGFTPYTETTLKQAQELLRTTLAIRETEATRDLTVTLEQFLDAYGVDGETPIGNQPAPALPDYKVLAYTLNHEAQAPADFRGDMPFIDGDTRTIQYEGEDEPPITQTFSGPTSIGGWYDE